MNDPFPLEPLDLGADEQELLRRYRFDVAAFSRLQAALRSGDFPLERNQTTEPIAAPAREDLVTLPAAGTTSAEELEHRGSEAIRRGQVAAAILNGGMATRFGGVVKGIVEVFDGKSFLDLKLDDTARAGDVPVFLMNSFATAADTRAHLEQHHWCGVPRERVHLLTQRISVRLTPAGEVFRDAAGRVSLYAPGHGDLFEVLAESEPFRAFAARGGKLVLVSNVDNIGATLSPRVIGAHLAGGREVTVEVAARAPGDKGGAPARMGSRIEVLEGFRFPPNFDIERIPVFNTNTMILDVRAVQNDYPLSWFRVDKNVEDRPAVQFERLMGQITAFRDAAYLVVPREGAEGRFLPVKTPADLDRLRPALRARMKL